MSYVPLAPGCPGFPGIPDRKTQSLFIQHKVIYYTQRKEENSHNKAELYQGVLGAQVSLQRESTFSYFRGYYSLMTEIIIQLFGSVSGYQADQNLQEVPWGL